MEAIVAGWNWSSIVNLRPFRSIPLSLFLLTLLLISWYTTSFAQNATLEGKVLDEATKEPLPGANVFLIGTAIGASTDLNGGFKLLEVKPGSYDVRFSYLSYRTRIIKVNLEPGKVKHLNAYLVAEAITGDTVVVTAQARGQTQAINQQLSSNSITNIVSADRIQELPDANAAESVGRLPGISIIRSGGEASQVVIRGLAPTYNRIEIAGVGIPSTDLQNRSVDLSMISPGALAGIEVSKTLTPNQDADAIGGTVNLELAQAPKGGVRHRIDLQYGYNGLRQQPGQYKGDLSFSERFFNEKLGLLVTGNIERVQRGADQFSANYMITREKLPGETYAPITTSGLKLKYSVDPRQRYGASIILDYEYHNGKIKFANFLSRMSDDEVQMTNYYSPQDNYHQYIFDQTRSAIVVYSDALQGEHHLSWSDIKWGLANSVSTNNQPYENEIRLRELGAFNQASLPTQATPQDIIKYASNNYLNTFLYDGYSNQNRSLQENLTAHADMQIPLNLFSLLSVNLQYGGKYSSDYRDVTFNKYYSRLDLSKSVTIAAAQHFVTNDPNYTFLYTPSSGLASMVNYMDKGFNPGNFLNGQYQFGPGLSAYELNSFFQNYLLDSLYANTTLGMLNDYIVRENVAASYVMARINYGDFLMLLPGVRYEYVTDNNTGERGIAYQDFSEGNLNSPAIKDSTSMRHYGEWFPMVNARIKPLDWFDIRLAYTRSYSRPQFSYIVPMMQVLGSAMTVEFGDPNLKPQTSQNYDLYFSAYKNEFGLLTFGLFYKSIDNLIFERVGHVILNAVQEGYPPNLQGFSLSIPENNPNKTTVRGIEVDLESNLMWLPEPFSGLVFNLNYTHIYSNTEYPISYVRQEILPGPPYLKTTVVDTFRAGDMPDQPRDVANLSIGYDNGPFSGRISMLYQGKTLSFIGERPELDIFTSPLIRWDISLKYRLTGGLSIFWSIENLTNRPDQTFQEQSQYPTSIAYYGMTSDLGFRFQF